MYNITIAYYFTTNVLFLRFVEIELENVYEYRCILDIIVTQVRYKIDLVSGDTI